MLMRASVQIWPSYNSDHRVNNVCAANSSVPTDLTQKKCANTIRLDDKHASRIKQDIEIIRVIDISVRG